MSLPRSTIWLEVVVRVVFRLFPTGLRKAPERLRTQLIKIETVQVWALVRQRG